MNNTSHMTHPSHRNASSSETNMNDESIPSSLKMAVDEVMEARAKGKVRLRYFNADGAPAFPNLYRHFGQVIGKKLLGLEPGLTGTLKEFSGVEIWSVLQYPTVQRMSGKYVANMVAKNMLSLKCVGRKTNKSQVYQTV